MDNQQGPTYCVARGTKYFVITYKGKESVREYIYIYVYNSESLCCTPETNTTL